MDDTPPPNTIFQMWPRGLSRKLAAKYIGVSPSLFEMMVKDGRMPAAIRINRRLVWDRHALDSAFDLLIEYGVSSDRKSADVDLENMTSLSNEDAELFWIHRNREKRDRVLASELGRLEKIALAALAKRPGEIVRVNHIAKGCGVNTLEKLVWRGYAEEAKSPTDHAMIVKYRITEAGALKARELEG